MSIYISNETNIVLDVPDQEAVIKEVIGAALSHENCPYEAEVNVTIADDAEVHRINREFRGIDNTTDVLSFPTLEFETPGDFSQIEKEDTFAAICFNPDTGELMLGDMIVSVERVKAQAAEYGHSELRELAFLVAHSMFHLMGYDHELPDDAEVMETKQETVLAGLGITR